MQGEETGKPVKIHVAIPSRNLTGQDMCGGLVAALFRMKQDPRYEVTSKIWPGFGLDVVRNQVAAGFLAMDAEYLIMVDDDIVPPDNLLDLSLHQVDIVGALCYGWDNRTGPFVVAYRQNEDASYRRLGMPGDVEGTGLQAVSVVGGGCFMIHRRVLEALPAPWFYFQLDSGGQKVMLSEDFVFCQNARQKGFSIYLDTDKICGHLKRVDLREVAALSTLYRKRFMLDLLE